MSLKKSKCLTLREKAEVLHDLNSGATVTNLSKKYGVAKATICAIKNKRQKILTAVTDTYVGPGKRKTLKMSDWPKMEKSLYRWFLDQTNKSLVSGDVLKQKAKLLVSQTQEDGKSFSASDGWLQRFKSRFGIRLSKIRKKPPSQPEFVDPFKIRLRNKILELGLTNDQLYNADEAGLYWKLLPQKLSSAVKIKTEPGTVTEMQRITFLACTNATGNHKLKPLVVAKAKLPQSLTNCECTVDYEYSESAWMTAEIFRNWFHHSFVPQVTHFLEKEGLPVKALLVLDNAPSHSPEEELQSQDGNIVAMYLPPGVTPFIQPMDQNVIQLTKLHYRNSLLASIVSNDANIDGTLRSMTLKDAVIYLTAAWNCLDKEVIRKCWQNVLKYDMDEDEPLSLLKKDWNDTDGPVADAIRLLNIMQPQTRFKANDVFEWIGQDDHYEIKNEGCTEEIKTEMEEVPEEVPLPSAISAINTVIQWAKESDVSYNDILVLNRLRERAVLQNIDKSEIPKANSDFLIH